MSKSKEESLNEYIASLPIRSYVLSNGMTIIGKVSEVYEDAVELQGCFTIIPKMMKSGEISRELWPTIPGTYSEECVLYDHSVCIDSECSFELKKVYCQTLIKNKVETVLSSDVPPNFGAPNKGPDDFPKNPYSDRWGS